MSTKDLTSTFSALVSLPLSGALHLTQSMAVVLYAIPIPYSSLHVYIHVCSVLLDVTILTFTDLFMCVNMFEDTNAPSISYAKTLLREKIVIFTFY